MKTNDKIKTVNVKNGDVELLNKAELSELEQMQKEVEEKLAAIKKAKTAKKSEKSHYARALDICCQDPSITGEELKVKMAEEGFDVNKVKSTISATHQSVKRIFETLNKYGHIAN